MSRVILIYHSIHNQLLVMVHNLDYQYNNLSNNVNIIFSLFINNINNNIHTFFILNMD